MPFQEVVEAEGHLIDSHIMENIFDKVVEYHGRFEVQEFRIGRTNVEGSYLRMLVETPDALSLERLLESLLEVGAAPADSGAAELRTVERDRCAPEDFYIGRCIYAMRVTDALSFDQYWELPRYRCKRPVRNGSRRTMVGDNIYHHDSDFPRS